MSLGVKFPFRIQSGSVSVTDNMTEMINSRVSFCLGTMIGERVMRSTWGVDLLSTVYSLGGELDDAMKEAVVNAFRVWFPDYEVRSITVERDLDYPTYVEVEVKFGRFESGIDETVRVGTQLPGGSEIYTNEGF